MASVQSGPNRHGDPNTTDTTLSEEARVDPQERIEDIRVTAVKPTSESSLHEKYSDENGRPMFMEERAASVAYRNLHVFGFGTTTDYQRTFANYLLTYLRLLRCLFGRQQESRLDILRGFEGIVSSKEMLLVLGRPGSGCTTLLKTLAGHTHGLCVHDASTINYQGNTLSQPIHSLFVL